MGERKESEECGRREGEEEEGNEKGNHKEREMNKDSVFQQYKRRKHT